MSLKTCRSFRSGADASATVAVSAVPITVITILRSMAPSFASRSRRSAQVGAKAVPDAASYKGRKFNSRGCEAMATVLGAGRDLPASERQAQTVRNRGLENADHCHLQAGRPPRPHGDERLRRADHEVRDRADDERRDYGGHADRKK